MLSLYFFEFIFGVPFFELFLLKSPCADLFKKPCFQENLLGSGVFFMVNLPTTVYVGGKKMPIKIFVGFSTSFSFCFGLKSETLQVINNSLEQPQVLDCFCHY